MVVTQNGMVAMMTSYSLFLIALFLSHHSNLGFQFSTKIATRVISALQTQAITMDKWHQLLKIGRHIGTIGPNMSNLWAPTLTFRGSPTPNKCVLSQALQHKCSKDSLDKD
jgi:hypothetical protein